MKLHLKLFGFSIRLAVGREVAAPAVYNFHDPADVIPTTTDD